MNNNFNVFVQVTGVDVGPDEDVSSDFVNFEDSLHLFRRFFDRESHCAFVSTAVFVCCLGFEIVCWEMCWLCFICHSNKGRWIKTHVNPVRLLNRATIFKIYLCYEVGSDFTIVSLNRTPRKYKLQHSNYWSCFQFIVCTTAALKSRGVCAFWSRELKDTSCALTLR